MSTERQSQWAWAGVVFQDVEGNFVAWQITRPHGQIIQTMYPVEGLKLDLHGKIRKWTGAWPGPDQRSEVMPGSGVPVEPRRMPTVREIDGQVIAHYPPLPLESGE